MKKRLPYASLNIQLDAIKSEKVNFTDMIFVISQTACFDLLHV